MRTNKLRVARVAAGLTQYELAGLVHVSGNYISKIELGHIAPSETLADSIADVLGIHADDVFDTKATGATDRIYGEKQESVLEGLVSEIRYLRALLEEHIQDHS